MTQLIDPAELSKRYREQLRVDLKGLGAQLKLVGFLSSENAPSMTYSAYTKNACIDVGIDFELRSVPRLELEKAIDAANQDKSVHGIMVYYPVFGTDHDSYIKDLVDYRKDIEGLNSYWSRKLYHNERSVDGDPGRKSILPCTPLAVVKLIEEIGLHDPMRADQPLAGKTVTVFNRSEVVGRPLASMLSNDGARVISFDVEGPLIFADGQVGETKVSRAEALSSSAVVITGVPSRQFELVKGNEIRPGTACINFSTLKNFADDIMGKASVFIPRVGPMTVTMALRNTLRLFRNFHNLKI